ncbi:MAG: DUF4037 domain-containing protein [Alphaproteobacteria bacterium]
MINAILADLQNIDNVRLIMLGGSHGAGTADTQSDYDIYVYAKGAIPLSQRKEILSQYFRYIEYQNTYWEEEDDGILTNGTEAEIIYRDIDFIDNQFADIFTHHHKGFAYSTCFAFNILNSKIIYDKNNKMAEYHHLKEQYPIELQNKIITENITLIADKMPALYYQIAKAIKRQDYLSLNHRLTAYFEIYFDILFALNARFHPGEKRLLDYLDTLTHKPDDLKANIQSILQSAYTNPQQAIDLLKLISTQLETLIQNQGYNYTKSDYARIKSQKNAQ